MSEVDGGWRLQGEPKVTLVAEDIRLQYGGAARGVLRRSVTPPKVALRGVTLATREGEMVGLVGLNGSGKSSLLRVLAGLQSPTSGTVVASAQPQLLGVSAALVPELSGSDNIWLGTLAMGMTPPEARSAKHRIEELADLGDDIRRPMSTYSSGQAARLRFAISVAADPEILMIDEALSTGDASFAARAREAMHDLITRAGTVFLVSHAAQQIEEMCTRALWIDGGNLVADGPASDVARGYRWYAQCIAKDERDRADLALAKWSDDFPPNISHAQKER